jgi:hypothetical protein
LNLAASFVPASDGDKDRQTSSTLNSCDSF